MPTSDVDLSERSGHLIEAHSRRDPRIFSFYFLLAAGLATLVVGLAQQQLFKSGFHLNAERLQTQRRIIVPGARGNIYDREGRLLVGNDARFAVVLYIDDLRPELLRQYRLVHKNYDALDLEKAQLPSNPELWQIARVAVAQRYLNQLNAILGRTDRIDPVALRQHFERRLLLPFPLVDGLSREDYAKLLERLPVNSPLQVTARSVRSYPYKSSAAHVLGYVRADDQPLGAVLPDNDLTTLTVKDIAGRDGLEKQFDARLRGTPGGSIFLVDPSGYRINPPLEQRPPKQGQSLTTSLDIDLQQAAEEALGDQRGAAVALAVDTGEVLVMASKPDYDLSQFSPRATQEVVEQMDAAGVWTNNAIAATYQPGSTFKILTSIAGLSRGVLSLDEPIVDCDAWLNVGGKPFGCYNGRLRHGEILLPEAIAQSCDIFFYKAGELITPDALAAEARRFRLDQPTGIELPGETDRMRIPDTAWKRQAKHERWYPGDTAIMAIGQGFVEESPLVMACFAASVARGETVTVPTLLHDPQRPRQHTEPIGLTPEQYRGIVDGMVGCTEHGTAKRLTNTAAFRTPGVRIAGKTGTAQHEVYTDGKRGMINYAWFICFAPADAPRIAVAVVVAGDTVGEETSGSDYAAPIAAQVLKRYFAKHPDAVAEPKT